jgi:hypothetical protein
VKALAVAKRERATMAEMRDMAEGMGKKKVYSRKWE